MNDKEDLPKFRPKEDYTNYVNNSSRKKAPSKFRKDIYERDGHKCIACGSPENLTLDHIIPLSRGGTNRPENLQTMCSDCNGRKGNTMPGEFVKKMHRVKNPANKKALKQITCLELQLIDCNCNDCKYLVRDFEKYRSFDGLYKNNIGQVTQPSHRIQYGNCDKLNKPVSFIPNTCQLETQDCFKHRRM